MLHDLILQNHFWIFSFFKLVTNYFFNVISPEFRRFNKALHGCFSQPAAADPVKKPFVAMLGIKLAGARTNGPQPLAIENFLRTNWSLIQHHKWSYTEIEGMVPWERQVYVALTSQYLKEEQERIRLEQQTKRR